MKIRRLISTLLILALTLSLGITAFAAGIQEDPCLPTDFALEQVAIIDANDAACPWSDETVIDSTITLYNMEQIPNGYVFKLKTGSADSGFIQIHDISGKYSLYCYAYDGDSEVECMADYWGTDLSDDTYIYFLGSFKYLIDDADGKYLDLATNSCVEYSQSELATIESNYAGRIEASPYTLVESSVANAQSYAVPLGSDDDFTWPIMDDFSGMSITYGNTTQSVHDHCSPTAATAIVRCLNHLGRTQCSTGETTRQTFEKMYVALNTNEIRFDDSSSSGTGTARSQIATGIKYYATQNGYTLTATKPLLTTLSGMKSQLDNNRLLLVSVDDFAGTSGGHSIVVTGYSSDTLYIQNGWSRSRVTYTYSSLDIAQYVYVGG